METTQNSPLDPKSGEHKEHEHGHEDHRVDIDVENKDDVDVIVKDGEIDVVVANEHGETTTIVIHTEHDHEPGHHGGGDNHPPHRVEEIFVNEKPVVTHEHQLTGLQIKQAAIAAGIAIQLQFVLAEERQDGTSHIVGDEDVVKLHNGMRFSAIRDDDNS